VVSGRQYYAGDILDEAHEARTLAGMRAAGATLVPLPNAEVEAAAAQALSKRLAGASKATLDAIMLGVSSEPGASTIGWVARSEWWIDVAGGDDSNDGATEAEAIQSFAELRRRLGNLPIIDHAVTVYVKPGSYPEGIDLSCRFTGASSRVRIVGIPTVVQTGVIVTFGWPTYGAAPGTFGRFADGVTTDWSSLSGKRLHFDPGGANDSVSFMTAYPGGWAQADVSIAGAVKQRVGNNFSCVASFPPSTPYVVEDLPLVQGCNLTAERIDAGTGGLNDKDTFLIENMAINFGSGQTVCAVRFDGSSDNQTASSPIFYGCSFVGDFYGTAAFYACGNTDQSGVAGSGGLFIYNSDVCLRACAFGASLQFNNTLVRNIRSAEGPSNCQFAEVRFVNSRSNKYIGGLTFATLSSIGIPISLESRIFFNQLWGQNTNGGSSNQAAALQVGGKVWYDSPIEITPGVSAPNDVVVGSSGSTGGTAVAYASLPYHDAVVNGVGGTDAMIAVAPA
jgi:hypothetical protein